MIVEWIIRRAQRTPYFHLAGYMNRWWLVPFESAGSSSADGCVKMPWSRPFARLLQSVGIAARVHQILRSDEGHDPHDHPWPYMTIVLRGGYWEHRYDDAGKWLSIEWRGAGSVLFRPARSLHRLELHAGKVPYDQYKKEAP